MSEATRFNLAPKGGRDHRLSEIESVAAEEGFVDRSPAKKVRKRKRYRGEVHNFSMRVSVDDADDFVAYCERERITYREGFSRAIDALRGKPSG
jgi:hypothetical protein